MNLVTIILTTLNSERFIVRSIDSCLKQTHSNLELLVVDGGSQDKTLQILSNYHDPRIRLIHQKENDGNLPGAINLGMANARGEFITWTQDDCWYEPHAIQTMVDYLESHVDTALVYSDYWDVDESGSPICYQQVSSPDLVFTNDVIRVSFLMRRKVYELVGPQEPRYFPIHEAPWRANVGKHFKIAPLHVPLMNYTVHSQSLTGRFGRWDIARMSAKTMFETGNIDQKSYRMRLAKLEMDQAYTQLLEGDYRAFRRHFLSGLYLNLKWLNNWGLWKLYFISLTPFREKRRLHLFMQRQQRADTVQSPLLKDRRNDRK